METTDPTEGLSFYDEEMEECACGYAEYVLSLFSSRSTLSSSLIFDMPHTLLP